MRCFFNCDIAFINLHSIVQLRGFRFTNTKGEVEICPCRSIADSYRFNLNNLFGVCDIDLGSIWPKIKNMLRGFHWESTFSLSPIIGVISMYTWSYASWKSHSFKDLEDVEVLSDNKDRGWVWRCPQACNKSAWFLSFWSFKTKQNFTVYK